MVKYCAMCHRLEEKNKRDCGVCGSKLQGLLPSVNNTQIELDRLIKKEIIFRKAKGFD